MKRHNCSSLYKLLDEGGNSLSKITKFGVFDMNILNYQKHYKVLFYRDADGKPIFIISEISSDSHDPEVERPHGDFRKFGSLRTVLNLAVDRFIGSAEKPEAEFYVHTLVDNQLIEQRIFLVEEKKQRRIRAVDLITDILFFMRNSELKIVGVGDAIIVKEVGESNEKPG
jgi:hypothetical protein